ncbi:MAG: hypothetical protein E7604_10320 [Ruminococcaceae bacterium]|nr:hypothetical protein [Oscillospiraceae bacterium]
MAILRFSDTTLTVDASRGCVTSLTVGDDALLAAESPLFRVCIRRPDSTTEEFLSTQGQLCGETASDIARTLSYTGFPGAAAGLTVTLALTVCDGALHASAAAENHTQNMMEWIEVLPLILPALKGEGGALDGEVLYPFNEGAIVDSMQMRESSWLTDHNPQYPSMGCYPIFPNMVFAQMMAYLYRSAGARRALYFGAHDPVRGVKGIDFKAAGDGVEMIFRYYCGVDYGADYEAGFPLVIKSITGGWEAAAEEYRTWFEDNMPKRLTKIADNDNLPDWYEDNPFVISYPVRGIHDMDIPMNPNGLYPYTNGLPLIDEIAEKTDARLLVLLMHWEGTAPWAPPYVWPPFGDPDNFDEYLEALHARGHMLGVYCSGFGYTINSNLIDYNCAETYEKDGLEAGMCAAPNGEVWISKICTGQRSGYDICPASELGRSILADAYLPLLTSKVDYAQILDQNHGGGQYFCYSGDHGHVPAPGPWMTENMQNVLGEWNDAAGKTLLGCESAAAEPFIGNLMFSDNRFELCYFIGRPVPLYAYIYHEYVRNFMGNQVCCPIPTGMDTLRYRMGYSFSIGDCMTVVLCPDGTLMQNWGTRDFEHAPDKEKALAFVGAMTKFYRDQAKPFLYNGRMIEGLPVECGVAPFGHNLPEILSSAWEADGRRVQILINAFDEEKICKVGGKEMILPANSAKMIEIE